MYLQTHVYMIYTLTCIYTHTHTHTHTKGVPATVNGMLGGFGKLSSTDVAASKKFLLPLIEVRIQSVVMGNIMPINNRQCFVITCNLVIISLMSKSIVLPIVQCIWL